jgi:hypothetical protein
MPKIFLYDAAATKVWLEADLVDKQYRATAMGLTAGAISGGFVLADGFDIPASILTDKNGDKQVSTWADAVGKATGAAQREAADALEALHASFRSLAIRHDLSTPEAHFLGMTAAAGATLACTLSLNPPGLLAIDPQDAPLLRAEASFAAGFTSPFAAAAIAAAVRIEVTLPLGGALAVLPHFAVPALPYLDLTLAGQALAHWSLDSLHFPAFPLFRLPLASLLKLEPMWTPDDPQVAMKLTDGELSLSSSPAHVEIRANGTLLLTADDVSLHVDRNPIRLDATGLHLESLGPIDIPPLKDTAFGPFNVRAEEIAFEVRTTAGTGPLVFTPILTIGRLTISAIDNPKLLLAISIAIELEYGGDTLTPRVTALKVLEPSPLDLAGFVSQIVADSERQLLCLIQRIAIPAPNAPEVAAVIALMKRIGAMAAAAAEWLLGVVGAGAAHGLAGIAEAAFKLVAETIGKVADAAENAATQLFEHIVIEVRIDPARWQIVQILVAPRNPVVGADPRRHELLGFELSLPWSLTPALVCDLEHGWLALAIQQAGDAAATLSTDLWLAQPNAPSEPVSGSDGAGAAEAPPQPLLKITATPAAATTAIALIVIDGGKASFFKELKTERKLENPLTQNGADVVAAGDVLFGTSRATIGELSDDAVKVQVEANKGRILSIFRSAAPGAGSGGSLADQLGQHISVKSTGTATAAAGIATLPIDVEIKIADTTLATSLILKIDLRTLSASLTGGEIDIQMEEKNDISLFGLTGHFIRKATTGDFTPLNLNFTDGNPRLGMTKDYHLDLAYDQLSTSGSKLLFKVSKFLVARDGIDLDGAVSDEPVTLAGVDMPFRFESGAISIKRSQIQTFSISGYGNLPPALVGEAKASIELNFAQADGRLKLQAATAVLDKSADPLRCEATQFTITVTKLGLRFCEDKGYHFYFTLTGSAEFHPTSDAFSTGLLKNLSTLRIVLDEAPLAADPRVLMHHIEFQVTVDPPKRSSFFDLFSFELRGVGFHPSAEAFDGSPAFSISGQVNFTDFADIVTPRFDFHQMWIAPPASGDLLPRIRFDGLGVGLALGSMAEASGTATAVDGKLPKMVGSDALPKDVTARGFLASGSLRIQGWASMAASMGFLELEKPGVADKRLAFFLYIQREDISEKIPTPIGTFFLREVGFGFGWRYTLAGIAAADQTETPAELVKILDEVSKYQGSLHDVKAWRPTFDNSALTLAMRGLFTMTSASSSDEYNEEGEKELPNCALFDIVAALRTDLTFLMNLRLWVAYNYADWRKGKADKAAWIDKPTLTGYMYLSAPRREFLARAVYNPGAEIGDHPKLPDELKQAMKAVKWSATMYVRPGLFHIEYGWPYELGFSIGKPDDTFYLSVEGGTVLRIEDASVLYGLAFRARGLIKFGVDTGGDVGASISGRADLALGAKLIAFLSANVSDSMFYGVITLDVTIEFSIRVWINLRFFSASGSFSRSITIHIGVELAVMPAGIAAQIEASVAVSAFGRTLSLGIGFSLGDGNLLNAARARSERFLALGLGATYPDPAAGAPISRPAPLPEPSRSAGAIAADRRAEAAVERREAAAEVTPTPQVGAGFGPVDYWALLIPLPGGGAGGAERYIVQLIPRDNMPLDGDEADRSHFYAAPAAVQADSVETDKDHYAVRGFEPEEILVYNPAQLRRADDGLIHIKTDFRAPFGLHGTGSNARDRPSLYDLFAHACFMAGGQVNGVDLAFTDTISLPWCDPQALAGGAEAVNRRLAEAARSLADCGPRRRMLQVEEARSSFIATVAEGAGQLASLLGTADPSVLATTGQAAIDELEFDPRRLGLTFLLTRDRLRQFIDGAEAGEAAPESPFAIDTARPHDSYVLGGDLRPIKLFNPPSRMFREQSPVLKDATITARPGGFELAWGLEPAWQRSRSFSDDPEFHLKHYLIERQVLLPASAAAGDRPPPPRLFTVKPADHIEIVAGADGNGRPELCRRRLRSPVAFIDDLQDLPAALREMLLPPALGAENKARSKTAAVEAKVTYTVLPVDCAGTAGLVETLSQAVARPETPERGVLKAAARFRYDAVPAFGKPWQPGKQFLALRIEEEEAAPEVVDDDAPIHLPPAGGSYVMRARIERTIAVGVFGADALSQARSEPPVPDRDAPPAPPPADPLATVSELDLVLVPRPAGATGPEIRVTRTAHRLETRKTPGRSPVPDEETSSYTVAPDAWRALLDALDIAADGNSERMHAARFYLRPAPGPRGRAVPALAPEWCPVQLQIRIDGAAPTGVNGFVAPPEPAVDTTVERFEHPLDVAFVPLVASSLWTGSGQLHLYHPPADARFDALFEGGPVPLLRDAERRTGVTLAWTARPSDIAAWRLPAPAGEAAAGQRRQALHALIGGYDLFALDATAVPPNDSTAPLRQIQQIGRVQRLPEAERGQEPAETGDFARVEAFYPSETHRLRNRGQRRRAPWYSPAESFLLWPKRPLRRLIMSLPVENDIAALFAGKRPRQIALEWLRVPPIWGAGQRPAPLFGLARNGATLPLPDGLLKPSHGGGDDTHGFKIDALRSLLRRIVIIPAPADDIDAENGPAQFANIAIGLSVVGADPAVKVTIPVDLAPALHPILADTLDWLVYEEDGDAPAYRRYEPVIEPAPPVNAERLTAFLDETAAERDPHGWGVLRTLGLAAAFRLYDIEEGRFVDPHNALGQLRAALSCVLPLYAACPGSAGAPFVDVLFTVDGLAELVSPHGAAPSDRDAMKRLHDKALALTQIELRPTVAPLRASRHEPRVGYVTIKQRAEGGPVTLTLPAAGPGELALIEIRPLRPVEGEAVRSIDMLYRPDTPVPPAEPDAAVTAILHSLYPKREDEPAARTITFQSQRAGTELAYVRIITLGASPPTLETVRRAIRLPAHAEAVLAEGQPGALNAPWGQFGDLPVARLSALLFPPQISPARLAPADVPDETLSALLRFFQRSTARKGVAAIADTPTTRLEIASRLSGWRRRFMEHGPAVPTDGDHAGLAFGLLTRPNPWRLAPDREGRLSVTLFEKDRWGKARKYAVRPFGRYETLVEAVRAHDDELAARERRPIPALPAIPSFNDTLASNAASAVANPLRSHFADVVIERTEPLAAPLILATRRTGSAAEAKLEIVVSRHPEEVLADANVRVDVGLSMRHVAVGFFREFAAPRWATQVTRMTGTAIDPMEPFGPFANDPDYSALPVPAALSIHGAAAVGPIRSLYEEQPDLWRGAYLLRLADMPYGFRLHALAHVAAGVVVSPSSAATLGEAAAILSAPWGGGTNGAPAWQDQPVPPPSWSLHRPADAAEPVAVIVTVPAIRLVDGMSAGARAIWFGMRSAPSLYRLPDPAVSYRLAIESEDGRVRVGEVEISAITDDSAGTRNALYLVQPIGSRFARPTMTGIGDDATYFSLTFKLPIKADAPPPPEAAFTLPPLDLAAGELTIAADRSGPWDAIAPAPANGPLVITLTPPPGPDADFSAFKAEVAGLVAGLRAYQGTDGRQRLAQAAQQAADAIAPFAVESAATWPGPSAADGGALPRNLDLPWLLGLPLRPSAAIASPSTTWHWPAITRESIPAVLPIETLLREAIAEGPVPPGPLAALPGALAHEARAMILADRRRRDEMPRHGLAPYRVSPLPAIEPDKLPAIDPAGSIDLVAVIPLDGKQRNGVADFAAAFDALANVVNAADTLESLIALIDRPTGPILVPIHWSCHAAALAALHFLPTTGLHFVAMIATEPPTGAEAAAFAANEALRALVGRTGREMLFGPQRRLVVQAFNGALPSIVQMVEEV